MLHLEFNRRRDGSGRPCTLLLWSSGRASCNLSPVRLSERWQAAVLISLGLKAHAMCSALPFLDAALGTSRVPLNGFSELYGSSGPQRFCIARRLVVEAALSRQLYQCTRLALYPSFLLVLAARAAFVAAWRNGLDHTALFPLSLTALGFFCIFVGDRPLTCLELIRASTGLTFHHTRPTRRFVTCDPERTKAAPSVFLTA